MLTEIAIDLDKLMNKEAAAKLRESGLHKVAAALLKNEGYKLASDEVTMRDVITVLGTKLRQKNAEYARIRDGLIALSHVTK
jgi:hypothetical protein